MNSVTIEVDGKSLPAKAGEMLIAATDRAGIYIPRFCYHKKLSIAANCRMCLVEVEKAPKPLPACATPVVEGMKVLTKSKLARGAQKGTLEFLLINHPLDCPVCDQGGECPLQDQAMTYGEDNSCYEEEKRTVENHDIGPLIATEMTRCIHCTRCVRFGEEVAGVMEMGSIGRGEHTEITTFLGNTIDSEVSGNMIDLCPVGALTSKPFRFSARSWELTNHVGISPHDCLGSNIAIQTLRGRVERVLPRENFSVNECWLSDRDRFSYEAVDSEGRLQHPMVKKDGSWEVVSWEEALTLASKRLQSVVSGALDNRLATLVSPASTLEEFHLVKKLTNALGSNCIDYRLQQVDFRDNGQYGVGSEMPIENYSSLKTAVLVGSNIRKEQPLLALRIREACTKNQAEIYSLQTVSAEQNFPLVSESILSPEDLVGHLSCLAESVAQQLNVTLPEEISKLQISKLISYELMAKSLVKYGKEALIIIGAVAQQSGFASALKGIVQWISTQTSAHMAILPVGNSVAAHQIGCFGSQSNVGQDAFAHNVGAYLLVNVDPTLDCVESARALQALNKAECVVQLTAFVDERIFSYADVLLPMATFIEGAGSYVNCDGTLQHSYAAIDPIAESRPGWKIIRVLGNFLNVDGFDYTTIDDVRAEIELPSKLQVKSETVFFPNELSLKDKMKQDKGILIRVGEMPMYRGDGFLRHAKSLQKTQDNPGACAYIAPHFFQEMGVESGEILHFIFEDVELEVLCYADDRVPLGCISIPYGHQEFCLLSPHALLRVKA